jgi:hypothetical protein
MFNLNLPQKLFLYIHIYIIIEYSKGYAYNLYSGNMIFDCLQYLVPNLATFPLQREKQQGSIKMQTI